ncbi:MAG TPA: hypothetical protein PLU85_00985 [Bacteroidia bacterium]|nr:hypothetical protein [Bacteroidia bacterium]QQR95901.1 MAG: hypothetical protein IPJ93_04135 [Bacteroidota bacterium]MBP7714705.1 hypothetical protein [Bacteroidia bacterium]MBP8668236.1 hypothetical protein [Bacteroidia bacterium]HOZ89979.1 hypothetical protein [Bacteroidia bacterium]
MIKSFFCLLFLLSIQLADAQHCQIKGKVLEKKSISPLDSVKIEIYEGSLMYKIIYSDKGGRFDTKMFQVISNVSFRISRQGYERRVIRFNKLKGNNVIFMDISLRKITAEEEAKIQHKEEKKHKTKSKRKKYARPGKRIFLPF